MRYTGLYIWCLFACVKTVVLLRIASELDGLKMPLFCCRIPQLQSKTNSWGTLSFQCLERRRQSRWSSDREPFWRLWAYYLSRSDCWRRCEVLLVKRTRIGFFVVKRWFVHLIILSRPPFKRCNKIYEGVLLLKFILDLIWNFLKNNK